MHNQPREPQPYEDCQAKSIQEFRWTSQGMNWGWGQGIKSHHTLLHKPCSTTRTPDSPFILDTLSPLDTLFYYFCSIKASPRPDATPTVSVVCTRGRRSLDSTFGQHPLTSSPLARKRSLWKPALGWRNNESTGLPQGKATPLPLLPVGLANFR